MTEIGQFYGYSITIGLIVSAITELIKFTQAVPFLSRLKAVQWLLETIQKGNAGQIRAGVAVLCVIINLVSFLMNGGSIGGVYEMTVMLTGSFSSFMTALGSYNLIFQPGEKVVKEIKNG